MQVLIKLMKLIILCNIFELVICFKNLIMALRCLNMWKFE